MKFIIHGRNLLQTFMHCCDTDIICNFFYLFFTTYFFTLPLNNTTIKFYTKTYQTLSSCNQHQTKHQHQPFTSITSANYPFYLQLLTGRTVAITLSQGFHLETQQVAPTTVKENQTSTTTTDFSLHQEEATTTTLDDLELQEFLQKVTDLLDSVTHSAKPQFRHKQPFADEPEKQPSSPTTTSTSLVSLLSNNSAEDTDFWTMDSGKDQDQEEDVEMQLKLEKERKDLDLEMCKDGCKDEILFMNNKMHVDNLKKELALNQRNLKFKEETIELPVTKRFKKKHVALKALESGPKGKALELAPEENELYLVKGETMTMNEGLLLKECKRCVELETEISLLLKECKRCLLDTEMFNQLFPT